MILSLRNCRIEQLPGGSFQIVPTKRVRHAGMSGSFEREGQPTMIDSDELPKLIEMLGGGRARRSAREPAVSSAAGAERPALP